MIRILLGLIVLALVGNLIALNFFVFKHDSKFGDINARITMLADSLKTARNTAVKDIESLPSRSSTCDSECVALINAAVDEKVAKIKIPTTTSKTTTSATSPTTKTREWIIPMGGGTISQNGQWVDIYSAQTQLDTANYPPIIAAYFEVVMGIPNAQGVMQARLYDTSTPYLFAGQVLETTSGPGQFLSTQFPIQQGNKSYHVQLNNSIGSGILDSSRIRLVTQ